MGDPLAQTRYRGCLPATDTAGETSPQIGYDLPGRIDKASPRLRELLDAEVACHRHRPRQDTPMVRGLYVWLIGTPARTHPRLLR